MARHLFVVFIAVGLALCLAPAGFAQQSVKPKPETLETQAALKPAKMQRGETELLEVRGRAHFSVSQANHDDSLTGTLVYTLPDAERQKIAAFLGKTVDKIPASVSVPNVTAWFEDKTDCPVVRLSFSPLTLEIAGTAARLNQFGLDLVEAPREMSKLICVWCTQRNGGRARRGVIARINVLLTGVSPDETEK